MAIGRLRQKRQKGLDWILVTLYLSLVFIGWLMLYSTVYDESNPYAFLDPSTQIGIQTLWVLIALFGFVLTLTIDWKFWNTFAYPIYMVTILALVLVLIIGSEIKGAKSWFSIGGASLQPSEFAKFGTALALSSFTAFYKSNLDNTKTFLVSLGIIVLPMFLILLQPDAGSALIFLSFFILFFRLGLSATYYVLGFTLIFIFILSLIFGPTIVSLEVISIGTLFLIVTRKQKKRTLILTVVGMLLMLFVLYHINPLAAIGLATIMFLIYLVIYAKERKYRQVILVGFGVTLSVAFGQGTSYAFNNFLKPHQQDRINTWLRPELCDPRGPLYNIIQSKMAIGSGGLKGKGFLDGTMTKLNYVPEQTTDFIFSTVGEEQGFLGALGIIIIFTLMVIRMTVIAERAKSPFIRNYAYCIAGIFFLHYFINIGMTMGLMPIVGIPLPFLSKGGSSLLGFTILIGTLIKMDWDR